MNKILRYSMLSLLPAAFLLFAACGRDESFVYAGDQKISFADDSIYFSFGAEPFSVMDTTLRLKVEIIGSPLPQERRFQISINPSRTTAREGLHYNALQPEYPMPSGKCISYVPVTIHRLNLDEDQVYTLSIDLEENGDFRLGVVEYQHLTIAFTNRLDCPGWWNELSHWLGEYNVRKYQKFIELNEGPVDQHDINTNKYGILRVFKQVKIYFEQNPQFGVTFPDVDWIV